MVARYYPAVVDRSASGFGISFPDLPGCVSAGASVEEAVERGHEALRAHIELMLEHGEAVPEPGSLEAIADEGPGEVVLKTLVRVDLPGRAVQLSITMDEALVVVVEPRWPASGADRSGFLARAARRLLRGRAPPEPCRRAGERPWARTRIRPGGERGPRKARWPISRR